MVVSLVVSMKVLTCTVIDSVLLYKKRRVELIALPKLFTVQKEEEETLDNSKC